jgi:anti-sigma B factor antagonist
MELLKTAFIPGDPPVLQIDGDIDLATADQLRGALEEALSSEPNVVIDMARVTFFDAAGIRALLQAAESRNGKGPLQIINAPRVAWVLELVGLSDLPSIVIRDEGETRGR